jgi:hypothetical protein
MRPPESVLRYGKCKAACAQALSYWETALELVAGLPGFPAYFFETLELNGDPFPPFVLAPAPREGKLVAPQLERTFEPVCPGAADDAAGLRSGLGTKLWRLSAKATPAENVSTQPAMALETLKLLIFRLPYAQFGLGETRRGTRAIPRDRFTNARCRLADRPTNPLNSSRAYPPRQVRRDLIQKVGEEALGGRRRRRASASCQPMARCAV